MALALIHHLEPGRPLPAGIAVLVSDERAEVTLGKAAAVALAGAAQQATNVIDKLLADAPAGSTGWFLPVEPILSQTNDPGWARILTRLRDRAS